MRAEESAWARRISPEYPAMVEAHRAARVVSPGFGVSLMCCSLVHGCNVQVPTDPVTGV